jgi:glycosyltransferase involved in cell wall biosynthesis
MRIVTNFERFPARWTAGGVAGEGVTARTWQEFRSALASADALLINGQPALVLRLCVLFMSQPWLRKPLVSVDIVLREPLTAQARVAVFLKRILLKQVSLFVHYFRDLSGYRRWFGIGEERSCFVPFKPNIRNVFAIPPYCSGEYVLCMGRSMRDFDTFVTAIGRLPYPTVIPRPDPAQHGVHGSHYAVLFEKLPPNVTLAEDDGSEASMLKLVNGAKLVVIPILKNSLCASGLSMYLNSMLLRKCVILSDGPGGSDVLTDQALICPPANADALEALIRRAWEDDGLRERTAEAGYRYAVSLGDEQALRQRVLDAVLPRLTRSAAAQMASVQ